MAKFTLEITHIDNQLTVLVNGTQVYDKYVDNDPTIHEVVDLTQHLKQGENELRIIGSNGPHADHEQYNPWHFAFKLKRDNDVIENVDISSPPSTEPQGKKFDETYVIENSPIIKV